MGEAKKFVRVGNLEGKIGEEKKPRDENLFGINRQKTDKAKEFED